MSFNLDFYGTRDHDNVRQAMRQLRNLGVSLTEIGTAEVPWFPTKIQDFDHIGKRILGEGDGIQEADHPGFRDPVYRERRDMIM